MTLRFKPVAGTVEQAGGIAVRLATPDDYYVVRANALEDNVRFYRVVKGRREQLERRQHESKQRTNGTRLACAPKEINSPCPIDGKPVFTAADKTFSEAGKIALWTKADSVTQFDTITITPMP